MELVFERLGYSWMLAAAAAAIGLTIAIPLGILSALKRNSFVDLVITSMSSLGTAMPSFWLGLMLISVFSVHLGLLPVFRRAGTKSPSFFPRPHLASAWPPACLA